jgi:hypothetical protein
MRIGKSDYTWKVTEDVLHIEDLNLGGRTVTNDIENVINEIYQVIGEKIKGYKIMYRDSEGMWDGVTPSWGVKKCVSCDFYHIGETDFKLALEKTKLKNQ